MKMWILFVATVSLLKPLLAQNETQTMRAEFRVFPVLSFEQEGIFYRPAPGEEMVELEFRARACSIDSYNYTGEPLISFYRDAGFNEEGDPKYRVVAQTEVVASEMVIFFTAKPSQDTNEDALTLLPIDDRPAAMPADHVTFLNFTSIPFLCRFMDKKMEIQPGANKPISVRSRLEEDILIGLAITNGETHRVVLKSRWQFHRGNRHHILLLPPNRRGSFRIRALRITEFVGDNNRFGQLTSSEFLTSQH